MLGQCLPAARRSTLPEAPLDEPDRRTHRELRLLRAYLVISTVLLSIVSLSAFRRASDHTRFEEIDVERINVVEKDGRVRLVLANSARSPGAVSRGQLITRAGGRPGLIF